MEALIPVGIGTLVFIFLMIIIFVTRFLKIVEPGKALIVTGPFMKKGPKVSFTGGIVLPVINKCEVMDISTKVMSVTREGTDGLICKDNIRADITVQFYIRINKNEQDVQQVATSIGVKRASIPETLNELFQAKFSEALKTVGKQMNYEELFKERTIFKEEIIKTIGRDLNGYKLEDTAIDYLSQTPVEHMDPNDIMDSDGIKKITELTSIQAIRTNEINQEKEETVTKRNVEAKERILELKKQEAEAEAKQQAEIQIIQARENAEKDKVVHDERLKAESARISTDEQLQISEANKEREVEIAIKTKERAIIIETEKIEKDRLLEVTEREKVVTLATIEKDKAVEEEKKKIQEIIRQRVAVERNVAEEQEKTKDVQAFAAADRAKKVEVTNAEKEAEAKLIIDIKSAEAKERAANHIAKEKQVMAETEKVTAVKIAEAKEIMASGIIAEESAKGLANVKVEEASAEAILKRGKAEAEAKKLMGEAEAFSTREMGQAEAAATKDMGDAQANSTKGMGDAHASASLQMGEAEANSLKLKNQAEAEGIKEKAESMKLYDEVGREHEEFKLKLNMEKELALEEIKIKKDVAMAQADVLSAALKSANIDIVGGEMQFFDKIVGSIISGKTKSALIENNAVLTEVKDALLAPGNGNLMIKLKGIIDTLGISSETLKNISISALLQKLSSSTDDKGMLGQIGTLKGLVDQYGLGDLVVNVSDALKK